MKNLRDAPAVVIGLVYILFSIPTIIYIIPYLNLTLINPENIRQTFNTTSPITLIYIILSLLYRYSPFILIAFFVVTLLICFIFGARKVNSLIVYYTLSIILSILGTIYTLILSRSGGDIYFNTGISNISFYTTYPDVTSSLILSIFTTFITIIFMVTLLYFLVRYKNQYKVKVVQSEVSIMDVLKK